MRIERRAFGELDARVEIERGFFGAHGLVDFPLGGHLGDGIVVEFQVAVEFAEFARSGSPPKGSTLVILASSSAAFTIFSMPSGERSDV